MSIETPLSMVGINANMVFLEEETLSQAPASVTLSNVPLYNTNRVAKSWEHDIRYILGSADYFDVVKLRKQNTFTINYDLAETNFIQYGIAPPAGTGTIAKTLTFILPMTFNGVQKYRVFDGCLTNTCNLEFRDYYTIEQGFIARNISKPMTEDDLKLHLGLTTTADLNFPAAPTDKFWSNLEPNPTTSTPLSIDGTPVRTTGMSINVERNAMPATSTAEESYFHIEAGYRGISGTVDFYHLNDDVETLVDDWQDSTITYTLNDSPSRTCTLTGVKFTAVNFDLANESRYVMLSVPFQCSTISVNTS